jgi:hypothetical protein
MTRGNRYPKIAEVVLGAMSGLVPLAVYVITLPRTITFEDSGQIITAAARLGISHPSGYPLESLIGQAFTLVPWGRMAWRVNLASAAMATACCVVLFFLLRRLFLDLKAEARVAAAAAAQAWEREFERDILTSTDRRDVYYSAFRSELASYGYALEPAGVLYRVTGPPIEPRPVSAVWGRYVMRSVAEVEANPAAPRLEADTWPREAVCKYKFMLANGYFPAGERKKALDVLAAAVPVAAWETIIRVTSTPRCWRARERRSYMPATSTAPRRRTKNPSRPIPTNRNCG